MFTHLVGIALFCVFFSAFSCGTYLITTLWRASHARHCTLRSSCWLVAYGPPLHTRCILSLHGFIHFCGLHALHTLHLRTWLPHARTKHAPRACTPHTPRARLRARAVWVYHAHVRTAPAFAVCGFTTHVRTLCTGRAHCALRAFLAAAHCRTRTCTLPRSAARLHLIVRAHLRTHARFYRAPHTVAAFTCVLSVGPSGWVVATHTCRISRYTRRHATAVCRLHTFRRLPFYNVPRTHYTHTLHTHTRLPRTSCCLRTSFWFPDAGYTLTISPSSRVTHAALLRTPHFAFCSPVIIVVGSHFLRRCFSFCRQHAVGSSLARGCCRTCAPAHARTFCTPRVRALP